MLNVCLFFCPCHKDEIQLFDDGDHKPFVGKCKHIVCKKCVENQEDESCPYCNENRAFAGKNCNYDAVPLIKKLRHDFWDILKDWWKGGNFDRGSCLSCYQYTKVYRICLTCDEDKLCTTTPERRLKMKSDEDILNLSIYLLCNECALDKHKNHGHEIILLDKIKYGEKDLKMTTAKVTLELFRSELQNQRGSVDCKLRRMRIDTASRKLLELLKELDYIDEGQCGYFDELVKMELINQYIDNLDMKMGELFCKEPKEDPICECTDLYEKIEESGLETQLQDTYNHMSKEEIERFTPGCPIFFRTHLEEREKLCAMVGEVPSEKVTPEPFEVRKCPLCPVLDHIDHTNMPEDFYVKNWMTIVHEFWNHGKPRYENYCLRCLYYLKRFKIGVSCEKKNQGKNIKCIHENCLMKDPYYWKYVINRNVIFEVKKIMVDGIEGTYFECQLQKIRMHKLVIELSQAVCGIHPRQDTLHEITEKVKKVETILEIIKRQWTRLKNQNEVEWIGYDVANYTKCKCTKIWEKNQKTLKNLSRNDENRKKYEDLKTSMTNMASFGLTEEMIGCPMDFEHEIVLDEETVQEYSEEYLVPINAVQPISNQEIVTSMFTMMQQMQRQMQEQAQESSRQRQEMRSVIETVTNLEYAVRSSMRIPDSPN